MSDRAISLVTRSLVDSPPVDSSQSHPCSRQAIEGAGVRTVILQPCDHPPMQTVSLLSML